MPMSLSNRPSSIRTLAGAPIASPVARVTRPPAPLLSPFAGQINASYPSAVSSPRSARPEPTARSCPPAEGRRGGVSGVPSVPPYTPSDYRPGAFCQKVAKCCYRCYCCYQPSESIEKAGPILDSSTFTVLPSAATAATNPTCPLQLPSALPPALPPAPPPAAPPPPRRRRSAVCRRVPPSSFVLRPPSPSAVCRLRSSSSTYMRPPTAPTPPPRSRSASCPAPRSRSPARRRA